MINEKTKIYLEYLDKEMTIMGLLSTFNVVALGAILNGVLGTNLGWNVIWKTGYWYILAGSILMLLAALSFYRQRAHLAWLYGQISLTIAQDIPKVGDRRKRATTDVLTLEQWLEEANSWPTWISYRTGFVVMTLGFIEYGFALLSTKSLCLQNNQITVLCTIGLAVLSAIGLLLHLRILDSRWEDDRDYVPKLLRVWLDLLLKLRG